MFGSRILLLLVAAVLAACGSDPFAPVETRREMTVDGLVTRVDIDRRVVAPGEEFTVTYTIRNTRAQSVELLSGCTSIADGVVYRNGRAFEMIGAGFGCFTIPVSFELAAGEVYELRWRVTAAIRHWSLQGGDRITPAVPGQYIFRVQPNVGKVGGAVRKLPGMGIRVRVR